MKLKDFKQILKDFKEEKVKDEKSCEHKFIVIYKKSNVVSVGYVTYGICLDCNEYVSFSDDYDYIMNKSILVDATFDDTKFEIVESFYERIDENLLNNLIIKYNEIKLNNSCAYIKSELEKVVEEYNPQNKKRV